jgi:hypothetical protein
MLHFPLLSLLQIEAFFPFMFEKRIQYRNFEREQFQITVENSLDWILRYSQPRDAFHVELPRLHCMATWSASMFSDEHAASARGHFSSFTLPSSSKLGYNWRIAFHAGAQRMWKTAQNLLWVTVALFCKKKKKTTLALCSVITQLWSTGN